MKKTNVKQLLFFILGTEAVGLLSSFLAGNIATVYSTLKKPPLSPPGWLFGIAWVILYALMGYAAYLIYQNKPKYQKKSFSLLLYGVQLFLNFLWSIVFFRFQALWLAVIIILLLDGAVYLTIKSFAFDSKKASVLLYPYFLWILFATYLNIGFALLN